MIFVTLFLALIGSAALAAEPMPQRDALVVRAGDLIRFDGRITPGSVVDFTAKLTPDVHTVEINSGGGDEPAALTMGELIQARSLTVVVRDVCMSGCANSILVAGKTRVLGPGAIVAFHGSATAAMRNYALTRTEPTAEMTASSARYDALYGRAGASADVLLCAADRIQLTTDRVIVRGPAGDRVGWVSKRAWWIPTDADLARFGIKVERTNPSLQVERNFLNARLLHLTRLTDPRQIVWGTRNGRCR